MKEQGERDEPQSQTFTESRWGGDTGTHKLSGTPGSAPTLNDMPSLTPYKPPTRKLITVPPFVQDFPGGSDSKASAYNVGDPGSIPESGRSPGEGNGNPLQYFCLENPMDGGAWEATVHGVEKSQTRLSDFIHLINM